MKKYLLLTSLPLVLLSCDVRKKDKIVDDSKLDSIQLVQKQKEQENAFLKKQKEQEEAMKNATSVQMIDSIFNFGTKTQGEKVEFSFRFKNTGNNPLIIFDATASCGCTVPEKPDEPIKPGETGFIRVVFDSKGKSDHQTKDVTVTSNAVPAFPPLRLEGDIIKK